MAARLAAKLFGCYRASDANDPETFLAAATATLSRYPEHVAAKVCDPVRGLPAKNRFLPAIAEIREDCDREMVWYDAVERRERDRCHTAEVLAPAPKPTGEARQRVRDRADALMAELKARGDPPKSMDFTRPRSPAEAEAVRRHFEARLSELKAEYASKPLTPGPLLRRGHGPPQEQPPPPAERDAS